MYYSFPVGISIVGILSAVLVGHSDSVFSLLKLAAGHGYLELNVLLDASPRHCVRVCPVFRRREVFRAVHAAALVLSHTHTHTHDHSRNTSV